MHVFIDTTETKNNLNLSGPDWYKLTSFLAHSSNVGFVARIVVEETANHFRETVESLTQKIEGNCTRLGHLIDESIESPAVREVDDLVRLYRDRLSERLVEVGLIVLDHDFIQLDTLINRALLRRRPFDGEGRKGFRDAVQWEVIVDFAKDFEEGKIVIITDNKGDFGEHGKLHEHLQEDLDEAQCGATVTVCRGLNRFVEEFIDPKLKELTNVAQSIRDGHFEDFNTEDFINLIARDEIQLALQSYVRRHPLFWQWSDGRVGFIGHELCDDVDVREIDDTHLSVTLPLHLQVSVSSGMEIANVLIPTVELMEVKVGAILKSDSGSVVSAGVHSVEHIVTVYPSEDEVPHQNRRSR